MKKSNYLIALALGVSTITFAQNVGINTDGSDPDANTLLHLNNHSASSLDSALLRIENEKATTGTGVQIHNSGQATTTAQWDIIVPGSSTDLRIKGNGSDHVTIQNDGDVGISTTTPKSTLDVQGSMGLKVNTITSATTLDQTHNVILCNTGPYTVTLPAATSNSGKVYYIKNIDSDGDDITIDGNGSETIDGSTTFLLDPYKHAVRIVSDGSNWHVLEESGTLIKDNSFTQVNCDGTGFTWSDVTNGTTGDTWMDRNLGALQVATSSTDADSYGDLYQWGRAKDGHQCRTSDTIWTTSKNDVVNHHKFIINDSSPRNWRSSINNNLWQGVDGINNPCPNGYRIPTEAEWTAEIGSWGSLDAAGAFASVLKLSRGGYRNGINYNPGQIDHAGNLGWYWSSTISGNNARMLWTASFSNQYRALGCSVRCIRN